MVLREVTSLIESLRLHRVPEQSTPQGARDTGVANCSVAFQASSVSQGNEVEHEIPFLKGYTVYNVEQIEGLPEHCYEKPEPKFTAVKRIRSRRAFFRLFPPSNRKNPRTLITPHRSSPISIRALQTAHSSDPKLCVVFRFGPTGSS
jgi:hypothetical protein